MMEQKLSNSAKNEVIARIGEVESLLSRPAYISAVPPTRPIINPMAQSPSTQKILDEMALEGTATTIGITPIGPIIRSQAMITEKMDKETGRAIVQTGKGTSGPKKW